MKVRGEGMNSTDYQLPITSYQSPITNYKLKTFQRACMTMNRNWRIRNGISRVSLATSRCARLMKEDLRGRSLDFVKTIARSLRLFSLIKRYAHQSGIITAEDETQFGMNQFRHRLNQEIALTCAANESKPTIFVSACMDKEQHGGWKYNGGIKELNCLVKLLRLHSFEAYMVSYDGSYEPWLVDHQPHISIETLRQKLKTTKHVRCVTSWATATAFIDECPNLYFWDMELTSTDHDHFAILADLYKQKIQGTAAISRTIQAWHMAHFERPCVLIPNLLDESIWFPGDQKRRSMHVAYMDEARTQRIMLRLCARRLNVLGCISSFSCFAVLKLKSLQPCSPAKFFWA